MPLAVIETRGGVERMAVQWAIWVLARVEIHDLVNGAVAGVDNLAVIGVYVLHGFAIDGANSWDVLRPPKAFSLVLV